MRNCLIFILTIPFLALSKPAQIRIGIQLEIPGGFSVAPVVDTDQGGVITRVWSEIGSKLEQSTNLIQFQSMPLSSGEDMDLIYRPKLAEFAKCQLEEKVGKASIFAKKMKVTEGSTKEKILHFSCRDSGRIGVYRFIEGTGKYGDALFILAYTSKEKAPLSQSKETMEKVLLNMKVVVARDFEWLK